MNDIKNDFERTSNQVKDFMYRFVVRPLSNVFFRLTGKATKASINNFKNAIDDVKKAGPTGVLEYTDLMSKSEMMKLVSECEKNNIKVAVKEVNLNTNAEKSSKSKGTMKSIARKQQRLEKNNDFRAKFNMAPKKMKDNDKAYIAYVNTSQLASFNVILERMTMERLLSGKTEGILDRDKDGKVDEKDIAITTNKAKVSIEDLNSEKKEFGRFSPTEFRQNFLVQIMTKEEYSRISELCHENLDHFSASVREDGKVSVRVASSEIYEYRKFAPNGDIHEYGFQGGKVVSQLSADTNLSIFEFEGENALQELNKAKARFDKDDYIITYKLDGGIEMMVDKARLDEMVELEEKKYSTETLLEEAELFKMKNTPDVEKVLDNIDLDVFGDKELEK